MGHPTPPPCTQSAYLRSSMCHAMFVKYSACGAQGCERMLALRPQFYRCPFHVCLVMALRGHASGTSGLFRVLALAVSGSEATPPWYPRHRPSLAYMVSSAIGLRCEPASGRHRGPDARVGAQDSCAWAPFGPDRGGATKLLPRHVVFAGIAWLGGAHTPIVGAGG